MLELLCCSCALYSGVQFANVEHDEGKARQSHPQQVRLAYQRRLASNYGGCAACAYRFPSAGTPDDTLWNERKVLCG